MSAPREPRLEPRRKSDFEHELLERAKAWIPGWGLEGEERDFGRAVLEVAARLSGEVAEHLDRGAGKIARGFLDWLAVRGKAARPARMAVAFKLADKAPDPVLARAPVRLQASGPAATVVFETETDVRLLPGKLEQLVGVDAAADAFTLPPPGLSSLAPQPPLPVRWQLKSFAATGTTKLQLDPPLGLEEKDMILEIAGEQYRITKFENGIVTIEPPLAAPEGVGTEEVIRKVEAFAPFDGARNRQEHALYLGHPELLNLEAPAMIEVVGAQVLGGGVTWEYWGKVEGSDEVGWKSLEFDPDPAVQKDDAVVLKKRDKGAVEPRDIGNVKGSRWIRAVTPNVSGASPLLLADRLELRVNCSDEDIACPAIAGEPCPPVEAEAMANTTPLAMTSVFYPLGREPKQFDAFYLGSAEAFSKKNARVQLCFEVADPTFVSLSAVRHGIFGGVVLAGLGNDRALHLFTFSAGTKAIAKFRDREALSPPDAALEPAPKWRLPVWNGFGVNSNDFQIGVPAGAGVWVWHERATNRNQSKWIDFGQLPVSDPQAPATTDALVYLEDAPIPKLVALRGGELFVRGINLSAQWIHAAPVGSLPASKLTSLVPIVEIQLDPQNRWISPGVATRDLVGVDELGKLHAIELKVSSPGAVEADFTPITASPTDVLATVQPVAFKDLATGKTDVVAVRPPAILGDAFQLVHFHDAGETVKSIPGSTTIVGTLLEPVVDASTGVNVVATARVGGEDALITWAPIETGPAGEVFVSRVPPGLGQLGGGPTALAGHVVVPGTRADVMIAKVDFTRRLSLNAFTGAGIVVSDSAPTLTANDFVSAEADLRRISGPGLAHDGEVFYPVDQTFTVAARTASPNAFPLSAAKAGNIVAASSTELKLELAAGDQQAVLDAPIVVNGELFMVDQITPGTPTVVDLRPIPATVPGTGAAAYIWAAHRGGRVAAYLEIDPGSAAWDAAEIEAAMLQFSSNTPRSQRGKVFSDSAVRPFIVVLEEYWDATPPTPAAAPVSVDASVSEWARRLGDTSVNPELSWEYWNGAGWSKLVLVVDETLHLKSSGRVEFKVPPDLASGDWAGKTNYWIRARLIGGDYGREQVTLKSETSGGVTTQKIERSNEGLAPPAVVKLHICYGVCNEVPPQHVLTQDSGSILDQSDANRTPGAIVEAFVPLAVTLGRLEAEPIERGADCPPDCEGTPVAPTPGVSTGAPAVAPQPAGGRALYLGFNAELFERPVNVLLLVAREGKYETLAPLDVATLIGERFEPLVVEDRTRALGESGLLALSFPVKPVRKDLFGKTLAWVRLVPSRGDASQWKPRLRGAHLNAVWARATETLTRELLGSSEGKPNLALRLARPPLLHDTLELRVREPLGEEELSALRENNPEVVLSDVENLPGHWVRWRQVPDPADCGPNERVYALDEASGQLRFGDGTYGAIPPIGRDSIVAFRYQRTEPPAPGTTDVPANSIKARTALGLVTPVNGVESAAAASDAAGGAPPEPAERVLRFGAARLRHRDRAVTARDFEDLALERFIEVVQARCFVRPGRVRLVVVMRGAQPAPSAAEKRELRRALVQSSASPLGAPGTLEIRGPKVRRLRVALTLRVATLDHAGSVSEETKRRIAALFDTASGGTAGNGWPLGADPAAQDIAGALIDTPRLQGIGDIELREVMPDDEERSWRGALRADELAMLAANGVVIRFESAEVAA